MVRTLQDLQLHQQAERVLGPSRQTAATRAIRFTQGEPPHHNQPLRQGVSLKLDRGLGSRPTSLPVPLLQHNGHCLVVTAPLADRQACTRKTMMMLMLKAACMLLHMDSTYNHMSTCQVQTFVKGIAYA